MDESQSRQITLLATMLLVMLGAVYLWEPGEEERDPDATAAVWTIEEGQLASVRFEGSIRPDAVVLEDTPEGWFLREPEDTLADPIQVDGLLFTLARINAGEPIDDADPADFGLAPEPRATVTAVLADGTEQVLRIGDTAPVGNKTYVLGADGQVVAVRGELLEKLSPPYDKFKDKQVVHVEPAAVTAITLEAPEGTLHVEKGAGDWWLEGFARADLDAVDDLVESILDMRLDTFLDPLSMPDGMPEPRYTLTVQAGAETYEVRVGEQSGDGVLVESGGDKVGFMSPYGARFLEQGPRDIGAKTAVPWREGAVAKVDVDVDGVAWSLIKSDDGWQVDGLPDADAEARVAAVRELEMDYRSQPVPPLGETWGTVRVEGTDGTERTITIGQREGPTWRIAADSAGGGPFLVPVGDLEALSFD